MLKKKMDRREMTKENKNSLQPMGIVQVRNIRNNEVKNINDPARGGSGYSPAGDIENRT